MFYDDDFSGVAGLGASTQLDAPKPLPPIQSMNQPRAQPGLEIPLGVTAYSYDPSQQPTDREYGQEGYEGGGASAQDFATAFANLFKPTQPSWPKTSAATVPVKTVWGSVVNVPAQPTYTPKTGAIILPSPSPFGPAGIPWWLIALIAVGGFAVVRYTGNVKKKKR